MLLNTTTNAMERMIMGNFVVDASNKNTRVKFGAIKRLACIFSGEDFANIGDERVSDWLQQRRVVAIISEYHNTEKHPENPILTYGLVQEIQELDRLPQHYVDLFKVQPKKAKAVSKPKAKAAKPKAKPKAKAKAAKPVSEDVSTIDALKAQLAELQAQLTEAAKPTAKAKF